MFGKPFEKFQTFDVKAIVEESEDTPNLLKKKVKVERLPKFRISKSLHPDMARDIAYAVSEEEAGPELRKAMRENKIKIAPAAHTVDLKKLAKAGGTKIPPVLMATMKEYDYYNVELGLNIVLGKGYKIPSLRFMINIFGDDEMTADTIAYNAFPDDQIKKVKIIGGKISLGLSQLFQLIPGPIGSILPNLLQVNLNPWEFNWNYDKIEILYSGNLSYELMWDLRHNNIYKGFNPTVVIKKRNRIKKVVAKVKIIYELQSPRGWKNFRRHIDFVSPKPIEVSIL
jgi:hypothetical protein